MALRRSESSAPSMLSKKLRDTKTGSAGIGNVGDNRNQ
jgi:hypothetical protein